MTGKVLTCLHCGNETSMRQVATHNFTDREEVWQNSYSYDYPVGVVSSSKRWNIYLCPVCNEITIEKNSWFSEITEPDGRPIVEKEIIYPTKGNYVHYLPIEVKDAFNAAIKVRNLDGAVCVLALRRSLEKMCNEQGAEGSNLFKKLQNLQERKILPESIYDISYILREEGNSAAHGDAIEFDKDTVQLLIDFTQTILDYVYTLPEKIKRAQQRIIKHNQKLNS